MYISNETFEQTETRLEKVIKTANFRIFEGLYYFKEIPLAEFVFDKEALAIVRDNEVWSLLIPETKDVCEKFKIFSFHFQEGLDNSGFVGWLATKIKQQLGTGVFVVCGQNSKQGGIFDYWGCPVSIAEKVIELVEGLRE
jgi:hypothetical protein